MDKSQKLIKPTLKYIAQLAGVSISTVSDVLKNRTGKVQVSESTRSRIVSIARDVDYHPNSAAHTLATGRTYNIGFLLSSKTTLGFANYYFGTYLSGVQDACKDRGYGCVVSAYDLSSLKDLIIPDKIRKKNIDGIIITGYVEGNVLDILLNYNIPYILVGQIVDFDKKGSITVARDMINEWINVFKYLLSTGCTHIGVADVKVRSVQKLLKKAIDTFSEQHKGEVRFTVYEIPYDDDQFEHARTAAEEWFAQDVNMRAKAIVSHDQWCIGFLSTVKQLGVNVPEELSVVSTCDTVYCKYYNPQVSALTVPLFEHAKDITYLLFDYIEGKFSFEHAKKRALKLRSVGELVVRETSM